MALSENEVVVQQACKTLGAYLTDTLSTLVSSRFYSLLRQDCCLDVFLEDLLSPCLSLLCGVQKRCRMHSNERSKYLLLIMTCTKNCQSKIFKLIIMCCPHCVQGCWAATTASRLTRSSREMCSVPC